MSFNFKVFISTALLLSSLTSQAVDKVVYGEDNRLEQYEIMDQTKLDLQRSTLAMIPKTKLKKDKNDNGTYKAIDSKIGLCSDAKFNNQVDVSDCSGFLIEKNGRQYVVTAGHCATSKVDCYNNYWVFDYAKKSPNDDARTIDESNVYNCKKIVVQSLNHSNGTDFALIELDRRVEDRAPLEYRESSDIMKGEEVFVIGHPSGLPSKVASGAYVRDASDFWSFETNLDTFSGNSGSAVFNEKTGIVEGILVRGDQDYRYNSKKDCYEPNVCNMESCGGEEVFRINRIRYLRD